VVGSLFRALSGGFLFLSSKLEWEWMLLAGTDPHGVFICLGEDSYEDIPLLWVLTPWSTVMRVNCGNLDAIR